MGRTIDYYFTPQSPWTYLGHTRFMAMARAADATVNVLPADFGKVFPISGGLPLGQRAPQRQAYRLMDLTRFSRQLAMPLNLQPKFFPVAGDPAARLIVAADRRDGAAVALKLAGAIFVAVWAQERDIADAAVLGQLLGECGLASDLMQLAASPEVQQRYDGNTARAIEAGVFGAPSYVIDGEIFWGQDRLEFVQQTLNS